MIKLNPQDSVEQVTAFGVLDTVERKACKGANLGIVAAMWLKLPPDKNVKG